MLFRQFNQIRIQSIPIAHTYLVTFYNLEKNSFIKRIMIIPLQGICKPSSCLNDSVKNNLEILLITPERSTQFNYKTWIKGFLYLCHFTIWSAKPILIDFEFVVHSHTYLIKAAIVIQLFNFIPIFMESKNKLNSFLSFTSAIWLLF